MRAVPLICVLLLIACTRTPPTAANTAATETAAPGQEAVKPVPATLPDVVARVNGEAISRAEFEQALSAVEANAGVPVPPDQRDVVFRQVLDEMIGYRLLIQETRARKVTIPNDAIDAQVAQAQAGFPSPEAFEKALASQNLTLQQLRANAMNDLAVQQLLTQEIVPKLAVTPAQIEEFYKNNPDQFKQAERVRASHILIGVPQGADEAARQQARTRAAAVLKDLKAGKDFAELAKAHSQDPGSAVNGGDLGYFQQGQMVPPFDQAAFTLKPGQTSELVETDFGVHIIRVADHQAARTLPLDEIRPQLQQYILERRRQEETQAYVMGLRTKAKIEILI